MDRLNEEGRRNERHNAPIKGAAEQSLATSSSDGTRFNDQLGGGEASRAALTRRLSWAAPSASYKWRRKSSFNQRTRVCRRWARRERRLASGRELLTSQLKISYECFIFIAKDARKHVIRSSRRCFMNATSCRALA